MRLCETYDCATDALRDMHLKHDASNELPAHVPNDRRVYTQKIHDRTLYIGVRHTDPVASLMERAIDAHAKFLQKMYNSVAFLQSHPFSAMPGDLLMNKDDTVALERYAAHIKTRDKDGECVLSVCVPMIDSMYVTFVNDLCVSLSRSLRYRDYLIMSECRNYKDEKSHSEHVQRSLEGVYAVLDHTLHLCATLQMRRAVHDAYRHVWSSYLLVVTHVLTCATSKCRELLEGKRNFGLAFLLCAFASAVGEYVLHSHRKYAYVDDTVLLTHLQRLNTELSNADHVYKQNVDKPTEKNQRWTLYAALSQRANKLSVTNANWIRTMNDLSKEVHAAIQAAAHD
ncbi:hypothetical protein CYMTET_2727 [Cymbomonas tetramitiformis]|uniref:Uncharacterized protein n=1 Tax=Cymbomonas tetramitiformis TaxID=36881 RepID=A0AAE0H4M7_9CHLO|nr:hypothetical protein CYMTET_44598 [Cymbomonas tetramitiformis]KAK3289868.1 hypothetical protein CYMTET_2727 [Cymbomonas tetramitiformis]